MIMLEKTDWPEVGELVIATVNRITDYGAYVTLDEYKKEGFLHISEISSSWVKNIRDFVREGEKIVLKVLRIDTERKQIDLSLRRVTKREKRERIILWKRKRKAESLLKSISQKLGMTIEEAYEKIGIPLQEAFGEVYEALERASREGPEVLLELGLTKEICEVLAEVAREKIKLPLVKVKGDLKISCRKPDGVLRIKDALLKAKEVKTPRGTNINIYIVSPPRYRIEVTAKDYKEANAIMNEVAKVAVEAIVKAGGEGVFERG